MLFLGYALLYCIYVAVSSVRYFLQFWKGELDGGVGRFHIVFLFFVAGMFAISLVSLFGYHIYLVLKNRTTLGEKQMQTTWIENSNYCHFVFFYFRGLSSTFIPWRRSRQERIQPGQVQQLCRGVWRQQADVAVAGQL